MIISVETDIERAIGQLRSITEMQQLKFAIAKALTQTAYDVQKEVRANMPGRFILRRQWIVQGIRVERATKENLTATVYTKDKFMALQESGGQKNALRNFVAIPTSMVKRTKTDVIAKSDRPSALGSKAEIIDMNGHKWLALKKARKGSNGVRLKLLYLLVPRAQMKAKLGLEKDGTRVVRARFAINLRAALLQAVNTAR
jgi:hypothetical protein